MIPAPGTFAAGIAIFVIVVWDAFESIILPRRVTRKFRLTRVFFKFTWSNWKSLTRLIPSRKKRETLLSFYGPLSLLVLVGVWAVGLVLAFGMMQYGAGSPVNMNGGQPGFATDIYLSGTTFFTLGLGDVVPQTGLARVLVVTEAGFGFGFLAAVIGYLPFIYGSFSKREVNISLLDARAGTPPTAGELLRRHAYPGGNEALRQLFKDWEFWAAELMESHLSYPVLAFFRSQHDNQSWIAALTAILDGCALVKVAITDTCRRQAELTFAIARHAAVDLSQVFKTRPRALPHNRLPAEDLKRIRDMLASYGLRVGDISEMGERLAELRNMYEPYLFGLAEYLGLTLPPWIPPAKGKDNWQTTAWGRSAGLLEKEGAAIGAEDHF
ncbi:MAG: two pore domain potassium channel family protein [Acidobacteria bacterium]|nr:MAG: two pore domain potassium channel family protein [Acidobacteriota bacterium]